MNEQTKVETRNLKSHTIVSRYSAIYRRYNDNHPPIPRVLNMLWEKRASRVSRERERERERGEGREREKHSRRYRSDSGTMVRSILEWLIDAWPSKLRSLGHSHDSTFYPTFLLPSAITFTFSRSPRSFFVFRDRTNFLLQLGWTDKRMDRAKGR